MWRMAGLTKTGGSDLVGMRIPSFLWWGSMENLSGDVHRELDVWFGVEENNLFERCGFDNHLFI